MVLDYIKNELFDFVHGPNCNTTFDVGDILDLEESVVVFGPSRKGNLIGMGYLIGYKGGGPFLIKSLVRMTTILRLKRI